MEPRENNDLKVNEFTPQEIIALKNIARQANEVRPIRHGRFFMPMLTIFFMLIFLAISIAIPLGLIYMDKTPTNAEAYGFTGFSLFLFLISLLVLIKSVRNMFGKGKPIITLTPDGFIVPHGDKFIPWNLLVSYNMTTINFVAKIIEFKVAKTFKDKQDFFEKGSKLKGTLFDKSIYRIPVTALSFDGLSSKKMMQLIETYIEADAARKQLDALNVTYN